MSRRVALRSESSCVLSETKERTLHKQMQGRDWQVGPSVHFIMKVPLQG